MEKSAEQLAAEQAATDKAVAGLTAERDGLAGEHMQFAARNA